MCTHRGGLGATTGAGQAAQTAAAAPAVSFNAYPVTVRLGRSYASATERAQASATRRAFIAQAQAGDQYRTGAGIGSAGADFEIVPYHRSPNGLGIRSVNGRGRPVALTGANVDRWIANGATLIHRNGS